MLLVQISTQNKYFPVGFVNKVITSRLEDSSYSSEKDSGFFRISNRIFFQLEPCPHCSLLK